jgi:hypothetical protein
MAGALFQLFPFSAFSVQQHNSWPAFSPQIEQALTVDCSAVLASRLGTTPLLDRLLSHSGFFSSALKSHL